MSGQISAITSMNLRSVRERTASTLVALVSIAGVVIVLIGVLSIAAGFRAVLDQAGQKDVVLVLRNGATDEMGSSLVNAQTRIVADSSDVARDAEGPVVSPELYVVVDVPLLRTGTAANVPLRGVGTQAAKLRKNWRIAAGRNFTPGTFEIVVGRGASEQFAGLTVGNRVRWGTADWSVVGIFEDGGSVSESEVWTDATVLQGVYNRGSSFQSMRVRLASASAAESFKKAVADDPRLKLKAQTEKEYYDEQSRTLQTLVRSIGITIAALMGLGAIFAALNTMYSAVSARTREIATLRALGFGPTPVVISVLTEALLIGLVGAAAGMLIAYFGFNGLRASTMNFSTFSQITFAFTVTPQILVLGLAYALGLAFIGGLLPGVRAARLPITTGLREL